MVYKIKAVVDYCNIYMISSYASPKNPYIILMCGYNHLRSKSSGQNRTFKDPNLNINVKDLNTWIRFKFCLTDKKIGFIHDLIEIRDFR